MGNFNRGSSDRGQGGRGFGGGRSGGGRGGFGGGRGFGDRDGGEREMFQATCAECGNSCEVPFRPNGNKPVYCRDCFSKINDGPGGRSDDRGPRSSGGRDFDRPRFADKKMYNAVCEQCGNSCEVPFRPTGEKPVFCRNCFGQGGHAAAGSAGMGGKSPMHVDQQFAQLNEKLDRILKRLTPSYARPTEANDADDMVPAALAAEATAEVAAKPKKAAKKAKAKKAE